jgi:hypothetical protein
VERDDGGKRRGRYRKIFKDENKSRSKIERSIGRGEFEQVKSCRVGIFVFIAPASNQPDTRLATAGACCCKRTVNFKVDAKDASEWTEGNPSALLENRSEDRRIPAGKILLKAFPSHYARIRTGPAVWPPTVFMKDQHDAASLDKKRTARANATTRFGWSPRTCSGIYSGVMFRVYTQSIIDRGASVTHRAQGVAHARCMAVLNTLRGSSFS